MDTLETLLQRHQQESQEGANLLDLLCNDQINTQQQREGPLLAKDQLHRILPNMLQIITGTEEQITSKLGACIVNDKSGNDSSSNQMARGGGDSQDPGLLEGYVVEESGLEVALQDEEEREQWLVEELESTQAQLHKLSEDHALLQRQRDALSTRLADAERALLEHVEAQHQAEKDRSSLVAHLRMLEVVLEEQESLRQQQEHEHQAQTNDLQQHIHTLKKELKQHQEELKDLVEEKEALQWLLLSQEEQHGQQVATLERSLEEERDRLASLEEEAHKLRDHVGCKEAEEEQLQAHIQELENMERQWQASRKDLELQLRKAEKWMKAAQTELGRLGNEVLRQEEERERLVLVEKDAVVLRVKLGCKEAEEKQLRARIQELENVERQWQASRKDLELRLRRADEWKETAQTELERLRGEVHKQQEERKRLVLLEGDAVKLKVQLGCKEAEEKQLQAHIQELESRERRQQASCKDLQLRLKRAEEWKEAAQLELGRLGNEVRRQQEEREKLVLLEEDTVKLKVQLGCKETEEKQLRAHIQELENVERRRQAIRKDLQLRLRRAEQWKEAAQSELGRLGDEVLRQQEQRERLEVLVTTRDKEIQHSKAKISTLVERNKELKKQERFQGEVKRLEQELKAVSGHVQGLNGQQEERERLEVLVAMRDKEVQHGKAKITILVERNNELKEEIKRLEQELRAVSDHIQKLNGQQEGREAQQEEAQKDVLETLTKACVALREREQQVVHLKMENETLRAELGTVSKWLSTSTERAQKLQENGQTDLDLQNQRLRAELQDLQYVLEVQEDELAYKQKELEMVRHHLCQCELIHPPGPEQSPGPEHKHRFLEGLSHDGALCSPELLQMANPDVTVTHSPISIPVSVLQSASAPSQSPVKPGPPTFLSDVSPEVEAKPNQDPKNTEQLNGKFVSYLQTRGISPVLNGDNYGDIPGAVLL